MRQFDTRTGVFFLLITVASDVPSTVALAGDLVVMLREAGIGAQLQLEGSDLFFGSTFDNGSWDVSTWRIGGGDGAYGSPGEPDSSPS